MMIKKRKPSKIIHLLILIAIFVLSSLPMFSQKSDPVTTTAKELQARLQLTEEQVARVIKIFKMAQSQAEMDRQNLPIL